ncbi:hypothetical protein JTE90_011138 [Oedothorax gibbosus]|uniref:Uncharacterized protein n=1 Tax=Oedothorax gibbosus TaxID=931172 RepID=A0AAV6TWY8_9ARAC|nr:hypothetical protein JTE90_011138 [Oedothorax gibbosus]
MRILCEPATEARIFLRITSLELAKTYYHFARNSSAFKDWKQQRGYVLETRINWLEPVAPMAFKDFNQQHKRLYPSRMRIF